MSRACARTARTPFDDAGRIGLGVLQRQVQVVDTASHCRVTAALASASARLTWAAHLLRTLSRSARARRRRSSSSAIRAACSAIRAA